MGTVSKLLIDEPPLIVLPTLAKAIGLNEAIFLQQLHYWIRVSTNEKEGYRWVYNSYESWKEQFPFWSVRTIKRIIYNLEKQGLIVSGNFNTLKIDKTKWYRINHEKVQTYEEVQTLFPQCQLATAIVPTCHNDSANLARPLPETTTKNTTKYNNNYIYRGFPQKKETETEFPHDTPQSTEYNPLPLTHTPQPEVEVEVEVAPENPKALYKKLNERYEKFGEADNLRRETLATERRRKYNVEREAYSKLHQQLIAKEGEIR